MTRKPPSPDALERLHEAMRKACERMEQGKAERDELAEQIGRLADEMGHNV